MAVKAEKKKAKAKIEIMESWCKGCEICVKLCPTDVLEMINLSVAVKDIEACTLCGMCELRCPDFAIVVNKE